METHRTSRPRTTVHQALALTLAFGGFAVTGEAVAATSPATPSTVKVTLSEWKVTVTPARVAPGPVAFEVTNGGTIPHAFEVEGKGIEKETAQMRPGTTTTLRVALSSGRYEVYCPVGKGSHEMLGMKSALTVGTPAARPARARATAARAPSPEAMADDGMHMDHEAMEQASAATTGPKSLRVTGGGTVVQILPGPFPFADSAMAVIQERPADQQTDLLKKVHSGPYSNQVAKIAGDISILAIDRGASGDSVFGTAAFTTADGARWKLAMDRVQTKDIPFNPRFGGVIMGLFYHGASGVHTPLVPTIQSSLALWAYARLWRNDQLVADDAMVHIMLLSRTRRTSDWALDCWDCSDRPIEELQLQVTPSPGTAAFDAPGGFLFVNWEKSSGERVAL